MPRHNQELRRFSPAQIPQFLELATKEGWLSDREELEFLLEQFPQGCLAAGDAERPAGFVTSIRYGSSGWLGNLVVRRELRGQGLGRALFVAATATIEQSGAETLWLTASPAGRPLYEWHGFRPVDTIIRWRRAGCGAKVGQARTHSDMAAAVDRQGWGDDRAVLLQFAAARGITFTSSAGFSILQSAAGWRQIGPWGAVDTPSALAAFNSALAAAERDVLFVDSPRRNGEAAAILAESGFIPCGDTILMVRGRIPDYRPEKIYGLGSTGSMG